MDTTHSTWMEIGEFMRISGLDEQKVREIIASGVIASKEEQGVVFVEAKSSTNALISRVQTGLTSQENGASYDSMLVERTMNAILQLHDTIVRAKEETLSVLKNENSFLKESLISIQNTYNDDRKTTDMLREELQHAREELEFMKRKYRLMWGKVSDLNSK